MSGPIILGISWCGIPEMAYAIREFGIRSLESEIRGLGNAANYGAVCRFIPLESISDPCLVAAWV